MGHEFAGAALAVLIVGSATGQLVTRAVALNDDVPLGADDLRLWGSGLAPVINDKGHIAFLGKAIDTDAPFTVTPITAAMYADLGRGLEVVARPGDEAPEVEGAAFGQLLSARGTPALPYALGSQGRLWFSAYISDPQETGSSTPIGLWRTTPWGSELVVRTGKPSPGIPGFEFSGADADDREAALALSVGPAGDVGFAARVQPEAQAGAGPTSGGLWICTDEDVRLIARSGESAPGVDGAFLRIGDVSVSDVPLAAPMMNVRGDIAFAAFAAFPEESYAEYGRRAGLWIQRNGARRLVALGGESAPGLPGYRYTGLSVHSTPWAIDDDGWLVFYAVAVNQRDPLERRIYGFWKSNGVETTPIAVASWQATPLDAAFISQDAPAALRMNSRGDIAFSIWAGDLAGIWQYDRGSERVRSVMRAGDEAPGADGDTFQFFDQDLILNARGELLFRAHLTDTRQGLWLYSQEYNRTFLVALEGAAFEFLNDGELIIGTIQPSGFAVDTVGPSGTSGLNDTGYLALSLSLEDSLGGVFVSRLRPRCPGDITRAGECLPGFHGVADISDFMCFLTEWHRGSAAADFTTTGECLPGLGGDGVDLSDFTCYLAEWAQGCP